MHRLRPLLSAELRSFAALSLCLIIGALAQPPSFAASGLEQTGNQNPNVAALSPTASRGSSVTVTARFADPDGVSDLGIVNILVNRYLDGVGACSFNEPIAHHGSVAAKPDLPNAAYA